MHKFPDQHLFSFFGDVIDAAIKRGSKEELRWAHMRSNIVTHRSMDRNHVSLFFNIYYIMKNRMATVAADSIVTPEIEDFWKILWHIDVYKDQESCGYYEKILDSLLPDTIIRTTAFADLGFPQGQTVSANFSKTDHDKDLLMNKIVKELGEGAPKFFPTVFQDTRYSEGVRVQCTLTGKMYDAKVFDINPDPDTEYINSIKNFLQIPKDNIMFTYIDTANKADKLINRIDNLFDLYTRASEMDPAMKPTLGQKSNPFRRKIFYERPDPGYLTYPAYNPATPTMNHGLSQFYCKHTVILKQLNSTEGQREKGKLNVSMTYIKNKPGAKSQSIDIGKGDNMARAICKIKEILNITPSPDEIERISLSKHHGDIAQVLDQHRIISIESFVPGSTPPVKNTQNSLFCFVSIDQNAISKYLSCNGQYLFYYYNDTQKLCILRPAVIDPAAEIEYYRKEGLAFCEKVIQDINGHNLEIENLIYRKNNFIPLCCRELLAVSQGGVNMTETYKNILKKGIQIAGLFQYIPSQMPTLVDTAPVVAVQKILRQESLTLPIIMEQKRVVQAVKKLLTIPTEFTKLDPIPIVNGIPTLAAMASEKLVILYLDRNYTPKKKDIDNIWTTIDLTQDPLKRMGLPMSLFCRVGSKFSMYWGTDIIQKVYRIIETYSIDIANDFIFYLRQVVIRDLQKLSIFDKGLDLIGVKVPLGLSALCAPVGGRKKYKNKTYKKQKGGNNLNLLSKTYKNTTLRNIRNTSEEFEDSMIEAIESELNDIDAVIDLYLEINKLTHETATLEVMTQLHKNFFTRIFSDEVTNASLEQEENTNDPTINILEDDPVIPQMGGASGTAMDVQLVEPDFFSNGENFFIGISTLNTYEEELNVLTDILDRFLSLKKTNIRQSKIENLKERIAFITDKLELLLKEPDEDSQLPLPEAVEDEIMEVNENEQFPPQNTTNVNTRKTLKRPRNNNNNNQPRSKRNIISGRKSRYANNKTYRKK